MGRRTSFDSSSLDAMRAEVRAFLIKVLKGFPKIKFSIEKVRMKHEAQNKPISAYLPCWFPVSAEVVLFSSSVMLLSAMLFALFVLLLA